MTAPGEPSRTADPPPWLDPRQVRAVLYLNGLRGEDLNDAEQDVHVRLLERTPEDLRHPRAWVSTVATRVALDRHRRGSTAARLVAKLTGRVEPHTDVDVALVVSVRAALARLSPEMRAVIVLRYYADLDIAAIADALDIPEGTAKSRLSRAQRQLRPALREENS